MQAGSRRSGWRVASLQPLLAALLVAHSSDSIVHGREATMERKPEVQASPPTEPGQEMKRLAFLLGHWKATDTYERSVFAPNGGSGSGSYKTVLGPGGFSLLTDYHYQGPQGESSGHQVISWDPKGRRYVGYAVTSAFPGCIAVNGNWEGANLILSGEFETRGMKVRFKEVFSDIMERSMLLRQYNSVDGGPSQLFGTTEFTRV